MTLSNTVSKAALCAWFFPAALLFGQDTSTTGPWWRPTLGFRVGAAPLSLFRTGTAYSSTTVPVAAYTYTPTFSNLKLAVAVTAEHSFSKRFSLGLELRFHHARFLQTTSMLSGNLDPNATFDDRIPNIFTESTNARYYEAPLVGRFFGLRPTGWLSRAYIAGGLEYRHVGLVRNRNEYSYADGDLQFTQTVVAPPSMTNQLGYVGGVGMRFIDEPTKIRLMPEVRFIRWKGDVFQGPGYHSAANQLEIGVGVSY
jgi:hypothetical protein